MIAAAQIRMLPVHVVAQRLGVAPKTIRKWCRAGVFQGAVKVTRTLWRIPESALLGFLKARAEEGQAGRTRD